MARLLRPLIALAGGVVWALCFARQALPLAPWLALVPLVLLLGDRRAARLGWLHGIAYWLTSVSWIVQTLETFGRLPGWLAVILWVAMAAYLGAYHAAFAGLGRRLWQRGGAVAVLGLPALWVALEWLRTYLWTGFPWNLAGYAWAEVPGALQLSAWVGSYGISFLVVLVNTAAARVVITRRPAAWLATIGLVLALLAFGARWAAGPRLDNVPGPAREVRIIQPNIPNLPAWDALENRKAFERLLRLSEEACDVEGALLIWPESAAWPRELGDPELSAALEALVERGCGVVLNSSVRDGEALYNSALLIGGGRGIQRYDKRHLVPYGEHVPLAEWLPFVGTVARMAGQFDAGTEARLLEWQGERLGMAICFEVIFPAEVALLVREGASLLVTITNDAWYGDTWAPWQHFRAARFRAAEMRRPLLRAAITGVSGVIGPDGRIEQRLGVYETGVLRVSVRGGGQPSPASRLPWLVPLGCSLAAAFVILLAARGAAARGKSA